ncbi:hypothetical protein IH601_05200 [Candidatus Bipolaricaulota bacterium]|nr:hypothetical protein [Candidatus Bipolaricaulota bacterium]TFH06968.1 MAG: hypothetical protein E4H08_10245 [Candidatus Atribacteria bacterium]
MAGYSGDSVVRLSCLGVAPKLLDDWNELSVAPRSRRDHLDQRTRATQGGTHIDPHLCIGIDVDCKAHRVGIATPDGSILEEFDISHTDAGFQDFIRRVEIAVDVINSESVCVDDEVTTPMETAIEFDVLGMTQISMATS